MKGNMVRSAPVMVINANRELEEMKEIFDKHDKMIMEEARRERENRHAWPYQTPFQPAILGECIAVELFNIAQKNIIWRKMLPAPGKEEGGLNDDMKEIKIMQELRRKLEASVNFKVVN